MSSHSVSGLCWLHAGSLLYQQVPLQNVRVDSTLYDMCAEVNVQQTYVNNLQQDTVHDAAFSHASSTLECVYFFPLDEESAVFSFVAELDGVVVEGRIREKTEAHAEYVSAIAQNRSAMLLEQSSDNIFQCKIGNLKFGSVCTITLTYMTLLEQHGRHNRLTLPMIIAPKYTPANAGPTPAFTSFAETAPHNTVHKGYFCNHCLCSPIIGTRHHCDTCVYDLCHGCYVQHDTSHHMHTITGHNRSSSHPITVPTPSSHTTIQSKLRDLTIKLTITMPSPILSIQCPSHPSETKITQNMHHATAFFHSISTCSLSKDFVLLVEQQRCFDPRVLCELDVANRTAAVSLAFIPPSLDMLSASQMHCELIFLIDCSGSMSGSSIECVRECTQVLLRSLPVHSRFNILFFGSTWSSLFPSSQAYDDTSLSAASQRISKLQANLGGTEIYPPLFHVLTSDILPTHPRQVFLLTDGQVSNVKQLVQLVSKHAVSTRLFTFGIGGSVDRLLCKKLAQAGRGKCEFVTAEDGGGSAMREKVVRQVARAMQPVLTDVMVDWRQLKGPALSEGDGMSAEASTTSPASFLQCPSVAPAIFMSSRYILHALNVSLPDIVWQQAKEGREVDFECEITITARSNHPHETEHMKHSVVLTGEQITQARVIHTLAAKERIRELEDEVLTCSGEARMKLEHEILQLAMKHTLSSSRTSFVVVYNPETDKERVEVMAPLCASAPPKGLRAVALFGQGTPSFGMQRQQRKSVQPQFASSSASLSSTQWQSASLPMQQLQCETSEILQELNSMYARVGTWGLLSSPQQPGTDASASLGAAPSGALFGSVQQGGNLDGSFVPPPWVTNTEAFSTTRVKRTGFTSPVDTTKVQPVADMSTSFSISRIDVKSTAFEDLIQLQTAAGMWLITPKLIDIVHTTVPLSSLTVTIQSLQAISKEHGVEDAVVGVILALQLLETHYKHRHAEWEMLATKALFFLSENGKGSADAQQEIKDAISKLLLM